MKKDPATEIVLCKKTPADTSLHVIALHPQEKAAWIMPENIPSMLTVNRYWYLSKALQMYIQS
jgi:hypothetical protein